jgi:hypothetical protein
MALQRSDGATLTNAGPAAASAITLSMFVSAACFAAGSWHGCRRKRAEHAPGEPGKGQSRARRSRS